MNKARLRPSSMYRWFECPGSVRLSEGIEQTTSVAAQEGTAAHALAEKCLLLGEKPEYYLGQIIEGVEVTGEMVDAVRVYVNLVRSESGRPEAKLSFDGISGTADFLRIDEGQVTVVDFKYGKGLAVEVERNKQLMFYALAASGGQRNVIIVIVQPRCPHPDGPIRYAEYTREEMQAFREELRAAVKRVAKADKAKDITKHLKEGDHCRFCPAAATCPKLKAIATDAAKKVFTEASRADDLAEALRLVAVLKPWIKSVEDTALAQAKSGNTLPGYALQPTYSNRRWIDEPSVIKAVLSADPTLAIFESQKLKSPAQLEKLLPKDMRYLVKELTTTDNTGVKLVKDDRAAATSVFEKM